MLFSTHADGDGALTYEDATWALHSQSKEVCLRTVISQCPKELILWSDVRRYKVSYWIDDTQLVRSKRKGNLLLQSQIDIAVLKIRPNWQRPLREITS
jgi:hypothetical protein